MFKHRMSLIILTLLSGFVFSGCADKINMPSPMAITTLLDKPAAYVAMSSNEAEIPKVPEGETFAIVNNNVPFFSNEELISTDAYHHYGPLDNSGRASAANACLGTELMPSKDRKSIGHLKPTGWQQARYVNVPGDWLYNRSHLIGYQLTGQNGNPKNLMTGTRWFNVEGMLPFENYVANYIERTDNHVRYRVTPVFKNKNLLASGVFMEGYSIEDNGAGIKFNIYVPNQQPGVKINYQDGSNVGEQGPTQESNVESLQLQTDVFDINKVDTNKNGTVSLKEAKAAGIKMPVTKDDAIYQYMKDMDKDGLIGE